jgi:TolB-like protein/DNA-binding winged helix-turn-helix (wHTH) protein
MEQSHPPRRVARFGLFVADLLSGELHQDGRRVKLQEQPFQVLATLLEHPGEIVTREELRQRLWPEDTFVDFDHSLRTAILKLREALGDDAEHPHFIETLPRRGYRFVAPAEWVASDGHRPRELWLPLPGIGRVQLHRRWAIGLAAAAVLGTLAVILALNLGGLRDRVLGRTAGHIRSIAVLPFENVSGNPQTAYLSDGLTGTLINQLAQLPGLQVMGRSTVYQYKESRTDPRRAGREMKVGAVVTGRVRQQGDNLIVGVEMIDVAHGTQIWGDQFNRKMADLFNLQQEVARTISERLSLRSKGKGRSAAAHSHSPNTRAYELFLKSRASAWALNLDEVQTSVDYARLAIEADPNFALAYAALAEVYATMGEYDMRPAAEVFPKAREAALKALELDNTLADPHGALALVKLNFDWDWAGAEREIERALELAPNRGDFHGLKAMCLTAIGRPEEAVTEAQRAVELDPYAQRLTLATVYFHARRYDDTIQEMRRVLEYKPDLPPAHIAYSYWLKGMYEEFLAVIEKRPEILNLSAEDVPSARGAFAKGGQQGFMDWLTEHQEEQLKRGQSLDLFSLASANAEANHKDAAFRWLEKAYEQHSFTMLTLQTWPAWDSLRDDPRFQDLLRRMNFPP